MAIALCLSAKNSSGIQRLIIDTCQEETALTLVGEFNGDSIQIDFDPLTHGEVRELISLLEHRMNNKLSRN